MHTIRTIFIIFILCLFASPVLAETYYVSPTGSQSDQNVINKALEKVAQDGGGTVYLRSNGENNVFVTNGPIVISSSNVVLTGDPDITVRVYSGSDAKQWFTGRNSIICTNGPVDNIEIYGFRIDGSCHKLPFHFHHSRADTAHDCERAIYIAGQTGRFCNNIKIHDMRIENCFSDGIHVRFAEVVYCYNNVISNCQHEGIFFVSVINGLIESNQIAGITSDCARIDNGVNCIVQNNYFFSYTGDQNSRAPKGAHNGIQIADAGASHGYDASKKPTTTTNIEVRWNIFANTGTKAVWIDSTGKGVDNVYVHDNNFVNVKSVTIQGKSVKLDMEVSDILTYTDITGTVTPSTEMSEKIFSGIFDFLSMDFTSHATENDTVILPEKTIKPPTESTGTITQYDQGNLSHTLVSVPLDGLSKVNYKVGDKEATHTLMIAARNGLKLTFTNCSIWSGNLYRTGNSLYIDGIVETDDIEVTCYTVKGSFSPEFDVIKIEEKQRGIFNNFIFFYIFIIGVLLSIHLAVIAIIFSKRL